MSRGFTLLEILVVIVIMGLVASLVVVNFAQDERSELSEEAQRLRLLMEYARDEAILQGQTLAWSLDKSGYQFARWDGQDKWVAISDEPFHRRELTPPLYARLVSVNAAAATADSAILFFPSGLNPPYELELLLKSSRVTLTGDALGRVRILTPAKT